MTSLLTNDEISATVPHTTKAEREFVVDGILTDRRKDLEKAMAHRAFAADIARQCVLLDRQQKEKAKKKK